MPPRAAVLYCHAFLVKREGDHIMPRISKPKKDKALGSPRTVKSKTPAKPATALVAAPVPAPVPVPVVPQAVTAAGVTPEERHRMVAEAAYYIALKKGFNSDPAENWFEAEKQVDENLKAKAKR